MVIEQVETPNESQHNGKYAREHPQNIAVGIANRYLLAGALGTSRPVPDTFARVCGMTIMPIYYCRFLCRMYYADREMSAAGDPARPEIDQMGSAYHRTPGYLSINLVLV
jgi:hypothetical protein